MPEPRAYTAEECRDMFLQHAKGIARYWANESRVVGGTEAERRKNACEGVLFSLLVLLDGGSGGMPAFDLVPDPHPDDEKYNRDTGSNWWPANTVINDCQLHELLWKK